MEVIFCGNKEFTVQKQPLIAVPLFETVCMVINFEKLYHHKIGKNFPHTNISLFPENSCFEF